MQQIILQGHPAFSEFRLKALQSALNTRSANLDIAYIYALEVYFINSKKPLDKTAMERTFTLLNAERAFTYANGFFVTPRKGTISPWSTKAKDIFLNCSISSILQVEKGVHYRLVDKTGQDLCADDLGLGVHTLYDRMTEAVHTDVDDFFTHLKPAKLRTVPLMTRGAEALHLANVEWGLAMSPLEIDYLVSAYKVIQRDPTDAELVMFSQINSEHCRHKIFNADWVVDGRESELSLFSMIRNTHEISPKGTLVAYTDNSAVFEGAPSGIFEVNQKGRLRNYYHCKAQIDILCKVETHNHPTAISPFPGAATGVGGEIRDEGATGIGGRSKAGLSAFMVSNLEVPAYHLPWEKPIAEHPKRLASPLEIMLEGPIGGASFGNEFGRPQLCGMFRTLQLEHNGCHRGYHKPIMAAGGMGNLKREHARKKPIPSAALIIQIGGSAMKIGLGGGAASSIAAGSQSVALDFDSVQRGNPEMERRCQQVIDSCVALGKDNPILSIHDIGAGGLSNGLPELVELSGGKFQLRSVNSEDTSMSPMEIWCNESQERYVLAIMPDKEAQFRALCERERCPIAIVGEASDDGRLVLEDSLFKNKPIDMKMSVLLGKTPKIIKNTSRSVEKHAKIKLSKIKLSDAVDRVLRFPAVASKNFLITIADRSVTGMVTRDQMVGPWQTPVADVAVTSSSMNTYTGEAMAVGERTPLAILNAPASGRIAIGECLTNMAAAQIGQISQIKLSANWMVASGEAGEDAKLYDTVKAVSMDTCPALGISIPVGKDSMSMRTKWVDSDGKEQKQISPLSLMITGFSSVKDVRKTLTPDLKEHGSLLFLIDLGAGKNRLGGSALAQVYNQLGDTTPDLDDTEKLKGLFLTIQQLIADDLILSYHDRSDGGLQSCITEMAIAGRIGIELILDKLFYSNCSLSKNKDKSKSLNSKNISDILGILFCEELGAVIEIEKSKLAKVTASLTQHGISNITHLIGQTSKDKNINICLNGEVIYNETLTRLNLAWSELSFQIQTLRDNPTCAKEELQSIIDEENPGTLIEPNFDVSEVEAFQVKSIKPKVAILREQGINGQNEMAFAFYKVGFECVDVHMTDLLTKRVDLADFTGLVACGGFSYGDVLGAGSGWAKGVLYNQRLLEMFQSFFLREDSFTLGVCNGCQMISQLKEIIPGAGHWPLFCRNRSEQFEARYANVEILDSPSIFFQNMKGSLLPIPVAHGEGQTNFTTRGDYEKCVKQKLVGLRYINSKGEATEQYPANPNGSRGGSTAFTTHDGRVTIMMPHPERCFRSVQMSYRAKKTFTGEAGPWLKIFQNAFSFTAGK